MNKQTVYVVHDDNGFIKGFSMISRIDALIEAREDGYTMPLLLTSVQYEQKCYTDFDWCLLLQDVEAEASTPGSVEDMVLEGEL